MSQLQSDSDAFGARPENLIDTPFDRISLSSMIMPLLFTLAVAVNTGRINGEVVDQAGQPVADAVVCVLDGATGVPVRRTTWAPFTDGGGDMESAMMDIAFARTDETGRFQLSDVPEGEYRLLAQSWIDAPPPDTVLEVNGPIIHLRGAAAVAVAAEEAAAVRIRPLGSATLVLGDHAANDETLLVLSTAPPRGDAALGLLAWPGPFLQSMIGFNRMPNGVTTVRGLPEGEIHVAVFSADNNPGFGSASLTLDIDKPMYLKIPFIAAWSDGIHQPPPALEELTSRVAEWTNAERTTAARQWAELFENPEGPDAGITSRSTAQAMSKAADRKVEVAEGAGATLIDVLAALRYVSLREQLERQGRTPNPWRPAEIRPATPRDLARGFVP